MAIFANIEHANHRSLEAIELTEQALALAVEHGHSRLAGLLHGNLGSALTEIGDYDAALRHLEAGVRMSREIGNRSAEANALISLAGIHLARGDAVTAVACAQRASEMIAAPGDRYFGAVMALRLGEALYRLQRVDEAIDAFHKAEELVRATGVAAHAVDPQVWLARVALEQGDTAQARQRLAPVLAADAATIEASSNTLNVQFTVYRVLRAGGDARARQWLDAARERLQEMAERVPEGAARRRFLDGIALHRAVREAGDVQSPALRVISVPAIDTSPESSSPFRRMRVPPVRLTHDNCPCASSSYVLERTLMNFRFRPRTSHPAEPLRSTPSGRLMDWRFR
jgi:tetratricopeptide (TPR) repeat protein